MPESVEVSSYARCASLNLSASGYGAGSVRLQNILSKLEPQEISDLMDSCRRAAEKLGPDAFCCVDLHGAVDPVLAATYKAPF